MQSEKKEKRNTNPRQNANAFSRILFWYTKELFIKGLKGNLNEDDLYDVLPEYDSRQLGNEIEEEWQVRNHQKYSMFSVFWTMFIKYYIVSGLMLIIVIIQDVSRPYIISKLVYYFTPGQTELSKFHAYLYIVLLIGSQIIVAINRHNYFLLAEARGIKARTAICSLLYRKVLRLPASTLRKISFGKVITVITKDINAFDGFFYSTNTVWTGLITALIVCYNMYQRVGLPALVAMASYGIFIPFQVIAGIWINSLKMATSAKTDARVSILQEVLSSIRATKMYVWEEVREQRVLESRQKEMSILLKMFVVLTLTLITALSIQNVTFYLVLMTFVWIGEPITADTIYYVTGGFIFITLNLSLGFPYGVFYISQMFTAVKRMQTVFNEMEVPMIAADEVINTKSPRIQVQNLTVETRGHSILKHVTADIGPGFTILEGPTSSGKTIFLLTILREFEVSKGKLYTEGSVSYACQEPWLFPSTIKQNILFGSKYNEKRYEEVVEMCALRQDFAALEKGDLTIVADGGINLSKGQQSRINLARAIYKDCDIYLLDDFLVNLDPLVSQFIIRSCILHFLRDKMVLLVSNNASLIPFGTNILTFFNGHVKTRSSNSPRELTDMDEDQPLQEFIYSQQSEESEKELDGCKDKLITPAKKSEMYAEQNKQGTISLDTYKAYIRLGGGIFFLLLVLSTFVITQLAFSYKDRIIQEWANLQYHINQSHTKDDHLNWIQERNLLLYQYTAVVIVILLMTLLRAYALFLFARRVSVTLHKKMLHAVCGASLKFFDSIFIGNIVNRFSKDLTVVDENIPIILHHLLIITFETVGNLVLIGTTRYTLLFPVIVLILSLILLRCIYIKAGGPLRRLEASTKNPVVGYLNATVEGLPTIKAFHAEAIMTKEFERCQDVYSSASYSNLCCLKAFVAAADVFTGIFTAAIALYFVIFDKGTLPGDFGMAISQASIMAITFSFAFTKVAECETQMTSVERAMEYTNIPSESKTGLELENWPTEGEIRYENVSLSLNESKTFILKNINLLIKSGERVGIVGRTGAGKSSIINLLFRLYDSQGKILIDGVETKTLSMDFLRSRISIIPQDAIIFNGTFRDNVDPSKQYTDEEIWQVMEIVGLKKNLSSLDVNIKSLDLTCGQKQLLNLGRALLKNNKILILDEMVEAVDSDIEASINEIIDRYFAVCTIIKIAHKLQFVLSCDKIVVIDNGQIVEYGSPDNLLKDKNGLFFKMVKFSEINPKIHAY